GTYARAMLPDMNVPEELPEGLPDGTKLVSSTGTMDHWKIEVEVPRADASSVLETADKSIAKAGKWTRAPKDSHRSGTESHWNFTDRFGRRWSSTLLAGANSAKQDTLLTIKIDLT